MFTVGEKVIYEHTNWADDEVTHETCTITSISDDKYYHIQTPRGSTRIVEEHEIRKVPRGPFGPVI